MPFYRLSAYLHIQVLYIREEPLFDFLSRTDLIEFIHESNLEDFIEDAANTILVSTMHKAKGREFDRVYLLLNRSDLSEASAKRVVYVALTRARRELHVH